MGNELKVLKVFARNFAPTRSFWFYRDIPIFSGATKSTVGSESSVFSCPQHLLDSNSHAIFTLSWLTLLLLLAPDASTRNRSLRNRYTFTTPLF